MKLSEAVLTGDTVLTNKLLKESLERFAGEMVEEYYLRREHQKFDADEAQKRISGTTKKELREQVS
jgi:hypothetical protein